jgi:hypothetical protein
MKSLKGNSGKQDMLRCKEDKKMRSPEIRFQQALHLLTACLLLLVFSGCAVVGPKSISNGRANYNEAINRTEDEQMLLSIVKGRYGETFSLLAVSGVAANVRFKTNADVEAGFGPGENYIGNLVPFSAGLAYEENPTITYAPVQGEQYLQQLMSPIPLDILVLSIRTSTNSGQYLTMLANRINDLRNPDFHYTSSIEADLRFQRFVTLITDLRRAGILDIVADAEKKDSFKILITDYAPYHTEKVSEYLSLLALPMPSDKSENIVIPIYFAVKGKNLDGMAISTRSTFDLIQILRAAIEVPPEHTSAGLAMKYPGRGLAGKDIHIRAAKDMPKRASMAVKYRNYWFYIDDADMQTKLFYEMVRTLWSVSIAAVTEHRAAPVMTIPVSR